MPTFPHGCARTWVCAELAYKGHRQWIAKNKRLPICPAVEAESEQYFENRPPRNAG